MSTRNYLLPLAAAAALTLSLFGTGCTRLQARDHLNKGVQAFKNAKYDDAIVHFQESIKLDPSYPTARLYLATAYRSQWTPGSQEEPNLKYLNNAKAEFNKVLAEDPANKVALQQMASIHYDEVNGLVDQTAKNAKLDEAKGWYERFAKADPNNATAYYSLGVMAWMKWYPAFGKARSDLGMKPEEPGPIKDKKVRDALRATWLPTINEGIQNLEKALSIDKEYEDAMAYINLLTRERADLAETKEAYEADIKAADIMVDKALETRKIKAARALDKPGGIKTEE